MPISPNSEVHPNAQIGDNVEIGPFCSIAADVVIGNNCKILSHVSIQDGVRLGEACQVFQGAILGSIPQDLKYKGDKSYLEIGDGVTIREYCTINRATSKDQKTSIGDHCHIMAYAHVAHDCILKEHVILSNNVNLAGHVEVGSHANLSGMVQVHQFTRIGESAYIAGGSLVRKDVPPYIKVAREPLSYIGVNAIGLRRRGFSESKIELLHDIYRKIFVDRGSTQNALESISATFENTSERNLILEFIDNSERGIVKGFNSIT